MDGLLVIDKPAGPTSHDVVARMRRVLRQPAIGHTGTLDPMATGVLPLVLGRATRLARFLIAGDKAYDAVVRIGYATDTADAEGSPIGRRFAGPLPAREEIDRALDRFRGTFEQQPPAFSAKKIAGTRSYTLARRRAIPDTPPPRTCPLPVPYPVRTCHLPDPYPARTCPVPVTVTVRALELVSIDRDLITLRVECSAGFYVRSLAHDLGEALGTGAHLAALRRTRSGAFTLEDAIDLATAERDPARAAAAVRPPARILDDWPTVVLTPEGVRHAAHGRDLGPADGVRDAKGLVRLLDTAGDLVGVAEPARTPGLLHPCVVLM